MSVFHKTMVWLGLVDDEYYGEDDEYYADEYGEPILIRYRGKPSRKRYEFIRDFLELKIKRLERDN